MRAVMVLLVDGVLVRAAGDYVGTEGGRARIAARAWGLGVAMLALQRNQILMIIFHEIIIFCTVLVYSYKCRITQTLILYKFRIIYHS